LSDFSALSLPPSHAREVFSCSSSVSPTAYTPAGLWQRTYRNRHAWPCPCHRSPPEAVVAGVLRLFQTIWCSGGDQRSLRVVPVPHRRLARLLPRRSLVIVWHRAGPRREAQRVRCGVSSLPRTGRRFPTMSAASMDHEPLLQVHHGMRSPQAIQAHCQGRWHLVRVSDRLPTRAQLLPVASSDFASLRTIPRPRLPLPRRDGKPALEERRFVLRDLLSQARQLASRHSSVCEQ